MSAPAYLAFSQEARASGRWSQEDAMPYISEWTVMTRATIPLYGELTGLLGLQEADADDIVGRILGRVPIANPNPTAEGASFIFDVSGTPGITGDERWIVEQGKVDPELKTENPFRYRYAICHMWWSEDHRARRGRF